MVRAPLVVLLMGGCILTEEVPAGDFRTQPPFVERCEARGYDEAVGCVLACGAAGGAILGIGDAVLSFAGADASYAPDTEVDPFSARCGVVSWRRCVENTFGGLQCEQRRRDYCAVCTEEGVALADRASKPTGAPVVPASVVSASALPAMLSGELRGSPGSCLAACMAVIARPPGCEACGEDEGCLQTRFGAVCHPRGPLAAGAACRGDQVCASLVCNAEGDRCD